jgi:hypothetical protein
MYALHTLFNALWRDILPSAKNKLSTSPADTAMTVSAIVTRAPARSGGIHEIIFCIVVIYNPIGSFFLSLGRRALLCRYRFSARADPKISR